MKNLIFIILIFIQINSQACWEVIRCTTERSNLNVDICVSPLYSVYIGDSKQFANSDTDRAELDQVDSFTLRGEDFIHEGQLLQKAFDRLELSKVDQGFEGYITFENIFTEELFCGEIEATGLE